VVGHIEQIAIAGDENIGVPGDGGGDDPAIGGIANQVTGRLRGLRDEGKRSEYDLDQVEAIGGDLELSTQDPAEFGEDDVPDDKIMLGEDGAEDIGAEAAGGEGGDEDVRVVTDSHETASKTSSSVR
jgi:hypothetical protein